MLFSLLYRQQTIIHYFTFSLIVVMPTLPRNKKLTSNKLFQIHHRHFTSFERDISTSPAGQRAIRGYLPKMMWRNWLCLMPLNIKSASGYSEYCWHKNLTGILKSQSLILFSVKTLFRFQAKFTWRWTGFLLKMLSRAIAPCAELLRRVQSCCAVCRAIAPYAVLLRRMHN